MRTMCHLVGMTVTIRCAHVDYQRAYAHVCVMLAGCRGVSVEGVSAGGL
jgi:hypothetical protein